MLKKIAVLVSGGGTNLQALIDAQDKGVLKSGRIACVISNKEGVYALERAKKHGIKTSVVLKSTCKDLEEFDQKLCDVLDENKIDLVVMAGFLTITGKTFVTRYAHKIINIHPSLIPAFCGKGYYGLKVHEAALEYGVKVSGATVHFVNEIADGGEIILQKAIDILDDDTPEILQKRIMEECEWDILPRAAELFCSGVLNICDRRVKID
jgi:phosphoribosylglycinamide formyltransferase, formyltetrahydrofolate-dependent